MQKRCKLAFVSLFRLALDLFLFEVADRKLSLVLL